MARKISFNKILENEFLPKRIDTDKIIESFQENQFDLDISDTIHQVNDVDHSGFAVFFDNEEVAYGDINLETGSIKCGGSTFNEDLNKEIEGKDYESVDALKHIIAETLNKPAEVEENDNIAVPTNEPSNIEIVEDGIDPVEAVKMCQDQDELDILASEYLMDDEYDLYIESKPDADFEDNKNFVLHLLTSGDEYPEIESESKGE